MSFSFTTNLVHGEESVLREVVAGRAPVKTGVDEGSVARGHRGGPDSGLESGSRSGAPPSK